MVQSNLTKTYTTCAHSCIHQLCCKSTPLEFSSLRRILSHPYLSTKESTSVLKTASSSLSLARRLLPTAKIHTNHTASCMPTTPCPCTQTQVHQHRHTLVWCVCACACVCAPTCPILLVLCHGTLHCSCFRLLNYRIGATPRDNFTHKVRIGRDCDAGVRRGLKRLHSTLCPRRSLRASGGEREAVDTGPIYAHMYTHIQNKNKRCHSQSSYCSKQ